MHKISVRCGRCPSDTCITRQGQGVQSSVAMISLRKLTAAILGRERLLPLESVGTTGSGEGGRHFATDQDGRHRCEPNRVRDRT